MEAKIAWEDMTPAERNALILSCRAGDQVARDLGLVDPGWNDLEDLGDRAREQAHGIAVDYARLIGVLPDPNDDGAPVVREVLRDDSGGTLEGKD